MEPINEWLENLTAQIHFKENSIPGVRAGKLTDETKREIAARIAAERANADLKARIDEWEHIDGDDAHYWDYREVGPVTKKVYLHPTERNDELEAQLVALTHQPQNQPAQGGKGNRMSNLVKHAENELKIIGMGPHDEGIDPMNRLMGKQILAIVKTFSKQGHSGFSANYAANMVDKLLRFEPVSDLTGEPHEWVEVSSSNGVATYQNNRCSHVFKEVRPDGAERAYDIDGIIFRDKDGSTWTNRKSHVTITFPYRPVRKYINRRWWKFWL